MRSGGKFPSTICFVLDQAEQFGGDTYHLTRYPRTEGRKAMVFPAHTSSDISQLTATWGPERVQFVPNRPFNDLIIVGEKLFRNKKVFLLKDSNGRVFEVEDSVLIDSALYGAISDGRLPGPFVWAQIPYTGMQPVRVGSPAHDHIVVSDTVKKSKAIPKKDLEIGDVLQNASFQTKIYLGTYMTRSAKMGDSGVSLAFKEERVALFYSPRDWKLSSPKGPVSSIDAYESDLLGYLSGNMSDFTHRLALNCSGHKVRPGRVTLPCDFILSMTAKLLGLTNDSVRTRRLQLGNSSQTYRQAEIYRILAERCAYIHLGTADAAKPLQPIYTALDLIS
jgi:hypothetical protein